MVTLRKSEGITFSFRIRFQLRSDHTVQCDRCSSLLRSRAIVRQQVRCMALEGQKPVDGQGTEWAIHPFEREGLELK